MLGPSHHANLDHLSSAISGNEDIQRQLARLNDGFFRFTILAGTTVSVRARADLIDVFCFELLAKPLGGLRGAAKEVV